MVNKVFLIGNLGRDPELRYTASGTAVANFTLATHRKYKNREGETQEETEWHRIVAWSHTAEFVNQYCQKGRQLYVEGRIQTREWEDREGQTRYTTEIVARNLELLGSRADSADFDGGDFGGGPGGGPGGDGDADTPVTDDDIPF